MLTHRTQKLHEYLGYEGHLFGTLHVVEYQEEPRSHLALTFDHSPAVGTWAKSELPPGQALRQPTPLFKKLDESVVEEEYARLEGKSVFHDPGFGDLGAGAHTPALTLTPDIPSPLVIRPIRCIFHTCK